MFGYCYMQALFNSIHVYMPWVIIVQFTHEYKGDCFIYSSYKGFNFHVMEHSEVANSALLLVMADFTRTKFSFVRGNWPNEEKKKGEKRKKRRKKKNYLPEGS